MNLPGHPPEAPPPWEAPSAPAPLPAPTSMAAQAAPVGLDATAASLAMRERALIEARYHRAQTNRRDVMQVRHQLLQTAKRPRFAEGARYTIKRGGKTIQDLSIRAAEEVLRAYPNIDVTERLTHEDQDKLIIFVVVTDLETGSSRGVEVPVPKLVQRKSLKPGQVPRGQTTNENNERVYLVDATADDLRMQVGSLCARARRNLLLDLLPSDIREEFEEEIVRTLENEERTDPSAVRKRCSDAFATFGITPQEVSDVLLDGVSVADCNKAQLAFLRSILTALREGATTWKEIKAEARASTQPQPAPASPDGPTPAPAEDAAVAGPPKPEAGGTAGKVLGAINRSRAAQRAAAAAPARPKAEAPPEAPSDFPESDLPQF